MIPLIVFAGTNVGVELVLLLGLSSSATELAANTYAVVTSEPNKKLDTTNRCKTMLLQCQAGACVPAAEADADPAAL